MTNRQNRIRVFSKIIIDTEILNENMFFSCVCVCVCVFEMFCDTQTIYHFRKHIQGVGTVPFVFFAGKTPTIFFKKRKAISFVTRSTFQSQLKWERHWKAVVMVRAKRP